MTACSHCGREAAPNNLYCQYCGQKLDAQPVTYASEAESAAQANGGGYFAAGPWMPAADQGASDEASEAPDASIPAQFAHGAPVATAVARGRLVVRSASSNEGQINSDEREFILDERDIAIGRSPSCDIALSGDQLASRRHALLRFKSGHYTIVDLGSSNGTYINDREIREETTLQDGDFIKIGGHEILFSTGPASPHASLAGAGLSMPLPASPLAETNPSVPAIDLAAQAPDAPADVVGEEEVSVSAPDVAEAPVEAPADEASEDEAEAEGEAESEASSEAEAGGVNFILSDVDDAPADSALDALHAQLNEVSAALAAHAAQDAATAARLRTALGEVRFHLASALAASTSVPDDTSTGDLSELVMVTRQAAENPRHLDYVTTLAARAGEIADALEARPASEPDATLRATIEGLLARIDELLA